MTAQLAYKIGCRDVRRKAVRWGLLTTFVIFLALVSTSAQAVIKVCDTESYWVPCGGGTEPGTVCVSSRDVNCRWEATSSDYAFLAGNNGPGRGYDGSNLNGGDSPVGNRDTNLSQKIISKEKPRTCDLTPRPVSIPTGEKVLPELDFGLLGLEVSRNYTKSQAAVGVLGSKWSFNFERTLTFEFGSAQCIGKLSGLMTCVESGSPTAIYDVQGGGARKFIPDGLGGYTTLHGDRIAVAGAGWALTTIGGDVTTFDAAGRPIIAFDSRGIGLTYSYDATNRLSSITHTSGKAITFSWSGAKIVSVTAPNGKAYGYGYNTNGYLASVVYPDNLGTRTYHYEDSAQPGGLTGYSNNGQRVSRYKYFPNGKVEWSGLEGGAERSTFAYGSDYTNVTSAIGQTTVYRLTTVGESKRIWRVERPLSGACAAGVRDTQYDANGNVDFEVDAFGVKTDYTFNSDNRLTQKISGIGGGNETDQQQITQYVWDATRKSRLNQIKVFGTSTSQPLSTTTYSYYPDGDARARLLQSVAVINHGGGGVSTLSTTYNYTLHPSGIVSTMTVDGPLSGTGDAITYTYDSAGNLLTVKEGLNNLL